MRVRVHRFDPACSFCYGGRGVTNAIADNGVFGLESVFESRCKARAGGVRIHTLVPFDLQSVKRSFRSPPRISNYRNTCFANA